MKNCGHRFHVQVANRDFIDGVLVKIISPKANPPTIVQDKVLSLIQVYDLSVVTLRFCFNLLKKRSQFSAQSTFAFTNCVSKIYNMIHYKKMLLNDYV